MNLFDMILLDFIFITFPLMVYLIYSTYTTTLDMKKDNLYLDIALFSSCYLLMKFGIIKLYGIPILIFDIPLILAYLKNKRISYIAISITLIIYYFRKFDINIYFCIFEYVLYLIVYLISKKIKIKDFVLTNLFITLKTIMFLFSIHMSPNYTIFDNIPSIIILSVVFYTITNLIVYLYNKVGEMLSLYNQISNIEKEKRIKQSLFKITHEIKNPIAVCKGYLDMFDINNTEHSRKYIPIIKSEIKRILLLLEDFLSITKIKLEKDEMDLNLLLEDTVDCLKPIFNSKDINFISEITDEEIYITADYNRLKQTLINILKNAREAIENEGTIKLYTKIEKRKAKIYIEDDGIGMDKEELNKIKEAFFTTKGNGTGLGTYMSNEIIKEHGGNLEYFSKKGEGTTVVITLPI